MRGTGPWIKHKKINAAPRGVCVGELMLGSKVLSRPHGGRVRINEIVELCGNESHDKVVGLRFRCGYALLGGNLRLVRLAETGGDAPLIASSRRHVYAK